MNEPEQRAIWKKDASDCSSPVGTRIDVTIKLADSSDPESNSKTEVLQEVAMTAQFRHPNIVKLHGVVNDGRVRYNTLHHSVWDWSRCVI